MSTPFLQSGAVPEGQSHWAPIWTNEFFTGNWTVRNPLRDAAVPYLYGKFYAASRYESVWDGQNMEIYPDLTWGRSPGHSVYNSNTLPAATGFFEFHVTGVNTPDTIQILMDTASTIYRIDSNLQKVILSKSAGAGLAYCLAVGNIMYIGDGVDLVQYLQSGYVWQALYSMPVGAFIIDTNNNVQLSLGFATAVASTAVVRNVVTIAFTSQSTIQVGDTVVPIGLNVSPWLNDQPLTVLSTTATTITAAFQYNDYATAAEGGGYLTDANQQGTLGSVQPTWSTTQQALTVDGNNLWTKRGSQIRPWGIPAPGTAPVVANVAINNKPVAWAASTYYMPNPYIIETVSGTARIFQLTTSGLTNSSVPTFNAS